MKRKDFLQKLVLGLGGVTILSCENDFFENIPLEGSTEDFSIDDAKNWYNLKFYNKNLRNTSNEKVFKRKPNFDNATKKVSNKNETTLIVPMDYEDQYRPSLIHFDEKTRWKRNLVKEYLHPIVEFLIISKEKSKFTSHLYQIAYDLYKLPKNTRTLKLSDLNGLILIADLDDKIKNATVYEKGKKILIDNKQNNKKGKVSCGGWVEVKYYTYEGIDCGVNCGGIELTRHTKWQYVETDCGGSSDRGDSWSGSGGGGNAAGSDSGNSPNPFDEAPIDPFYIKPLDGCLLASGDGNSKNDLNQRLNDTLYAVGLTTDLLGFSWDKAEAMSRSIGAEMTFFNIGEMGNSIGKKLGYFGVILGTTQLYIGWHEDGFQWEMDKDLGNAVQVAVGVAALVASPWIAVGLGTFSLGIAIYSKSCE